MTTWKMSTSQTLGTNPRDVRGMRYKFSLIRTRPGTHYKTIYLVWVLIKKSLPLGSFRGAEWFPSKFEFQRYFDCN